MTTKQTKTLIAALGLSASLLLAGGAQAGAITYQIDVDTTAFEGQSGYIDLELDPGNPPVDQATATISDFATDGTLGTVLPPIGDASGSLADSVVINNTDLPNDYTQAFTIGSFFDVFVELDIPNVSGNATGGNSFTLDLEGTDNFNSLFGTFPAVEIDLDATTGDPTVTDNAGSAADVQQTPEPATFALLGIALAFLSRRYARKRSRLQPPGHDCLDNN